MSRNIQYMPQAGSLEFSMKYKIQKGGLKQTTMSACGLIHIGKLNCKCPILSFKMHT